MKDSEDSFLNLIEERVAFYLGDCLNKQYVNIPAETIMHLGSNYYHVYNPNILRKRGFTHLNEIYIKPLTAVINKYNIFDKNIYIMPGDTNRESLDFPTLSKTRRIHEANHNFALIKCFEQSRHWKYCYVKDNTRYEDKLNKAIWRGTTTGIYEYDETTDSIKKTRQNNRITLIDNYLLSNRVNIGISKISHNFLKAKYKHAVKKPITINQFRKYKYIISIEGNDKDSGLNWKLMSNSVVLMAKPIYNSWLMEEKLIPNFHYVELKDDLSDLEEKINWCDENPDQCKDIINNAHEYMKQFFDEEAEKIIERKVITSFIESTNK